MEIEMKTAQMNIIIKSVMALILMIGLLAAVGCSRFDNPTATQPTTESEMGLWNPQPGDRVVPDHEIPMLNPGYWESVYGQTVNPYMIPPRTMHVGEDGAVIRLG